KKIDSRDLHLRHLRRLIKTVRAIDQTVDEKYAAWYAAPRKSKRDRALTEFKKRDKKLQDSFARFYYKQRVIEEMALVAENIHDKIQISLRVIRDAKERTS